MTFTLPKIDKAPVPLPHFPTRQQAFIFRAAEFFTFKKIAQILHVDENTVRNAAFDMGIKTEQTDTVWQERGYITIIKAMWHLLPYEQLIELLETDADSLAVLLREDDFLDVKLGNKPDCEPLYWRELTADEQSATAAIEAVMDTVRLEGKKPFEFEFINPEIRFNGNDIFEIRMIYLFSGLYLKAFDVDSETYCPDSLLASYQKLGVNAIWMQAVLYMLQPHPFNPALSSGWENRLKNLKKLVARCAKFGIKVFLYLNEPRAMNNGAFADFPHLKGHTMGENSCLCTSTPQVQDYIRDTVENLCRAVSDLGGFFTITRSENVTNCYSHSTPETCTCPRCKSRSVGEVIGETLQCIRDGIDRVNPAIKLFAWNWRWDEYAEDIIAHLPPRTVVQCQSELDMPYTIGGVSGNVADYSMGIIGPSECSTKQWALAKARGLETAAKVQVNTTWEGSTVPALPIYPLVNEHLQRLQKAGVKHLMLSWTLGGYPSENLLYAARNFNDNVQMPPASPALQQACEIFAQAFQEFPFHVRVLYRGPQNGGPSNLLFEQPTGYQATMTCFAYDDLQSWRGRDVYPEDVFENQFAKLCARFKDGLKILENEPDSETKVMAKAAYCIYRSSLDQIRFYRAREAGNQAAMLAAAKSEKETAVTMLQLMNQNAAIGFEAANHYYFSRFGLCEKLLNCEWLIQKLS